MPAPVINPQFSIADETRVGRPLSFGLALAAGSDAATSWSVLDTLPPGLSLNATTGRISGSPTIAGPSTFRIVAINGSGTSTPVTLTLGIEALPYVTPGVLEINADIDSGVVWNPAITNGGAPLWGTFGDKKNISLGIMKRGILQQLPVASVNLLMRTTEDGEPFAISTGNWVQAGAGDNTRYIVYVNLDRPEIAAAMAEWDKPSINPGFVWVEIEVILTQPLPGLTSPVAQPLSFRKVIMELQDDLN
jgi:hypothetical protein